jgi:plasmid replication initiation protein
LTKINDLKNIFKNIFEKFSSSISDTQEHEHEELFRQKILHEEEVTRHQNWKIQGQPLSPNLFLAPKNFQLLALVKLPQA